MNNGSNSQGRKPLAPTDPNTQRVSEKLNINKLVSYQMCFLITISFLAGAIYKLILQ